MFEIFFMKSFSMSLSYWNTEKRLFSGIGNENAFQSGFRLEVRTPALCYEGHC